MMHCLCISQISDHEYYLLKLYQRSIFTTILCIVVVQVEV